MTVCTASGPVRLGRGLAVAPPVAPPVGCGEVPRGLGSPAPPRLGLSAPVPALCPGLVCEVGMTIAATFQPTSQGCCGDTVISDCHVVMRRAASPPS